MCPSYMATKDEQHTTRGRANILREVLTNSKKANRLPINEEIRTDKVKADGPTMRGIEIGNTAMFLMFLSSSISSEKFFFLLIRFSKTISYEINNKKIPPTI